MRPHSIWQSLLLALAFGLTALNIAPSLCAKDKSAVNYKALSESELQRCKDKNKRRAQQAMAADERQLGKKEMAELETLYQAANSNPRTPEAQDKFKEVLKKFPKSNRAGCACLYLGQFSPDAREKEKYLKLAIADYSDCYYLNGAQVGGWARLLMASLLQGEGKESESKKLLEEIITHYAECTTHTGQSLAASAHRMLAKP